MASCSKDYSITIASACPAVVEAITLGANPIGVSQGGLAIGNAASGNVLAVARLQDTTLLNRDSAYTLLANVANSATGGPTEIIWIPGVEDFWCAEGIYGFGILQVINANTHLQVAEFNDGTFGANYSCLCYHSGNNRVLAYRFNEGTGNYDRDYFNPTHPPAYVTSSPGFLSETKTPKFMAYSITSNQLYTGWHDSAGPPTDWIVCEDAVYGGIATFDVGTLVLSQACWVPETNEIWFTANAAPTYKIGIIDCATNTLVDWIDLTYTGGAARGEWCGGCGGFLRSGRA